MLDRRRFLAATGVTLAGACFVSPDDPSGAPQPLMERHFPSRLHQFVWRNWELANIERLAQVAAAAPEQILGIGSSMGLPPKPALDADQLRRIYVTVIRQNWHLLPEEQLIELLGWDREKLAFTLKEDDFLSHKLGPKPACEPVRYSEPGPAERQRSAEISRILRDVLGDRLTEPGEPPFQFIERLSAPGVAGLSAKVAVQGNARFDLRYLYSYFALYGDPLLEPDIDPFPDGYLEKLAAVGINGVWMQAVLSTLAPSEHFPEFGEGWQRRAETLNALTERAARHGIKLLLYINEPRAQRPEFFEKYPDLKGAQHQELHAMCTAQPAVRQWISDGLAHLFTHAPGLGGVFSISMSENLTNCFSKWTSDTCPRCSRRSASEAVLEVAHAIREGVRRGSKEAEIIIWDWGWLPWGSRQGDMGSEVIPHLPQDVRLLSVSEWDKPLNRGGVETEVGEYSISVVGPGPRARKNWALAKRHGIRPMAKTQFNNTWEISAVPYIPVPNLIAEHCENLGVAGVSGLMVSWTLGGYPSPNLEVAAEYYVSPDASRGEILKGVATRRYGAEAAPRIIEAWSAFSRAFQEFPYGISTYVIPAQHGPANLLRPEPTGVNASMLLFPQDDYERWLGQYPASVVRDQFAKLASLWEKGTVAFQKALAATPESRKSGIREDLAIAEVCRIHFRSVANQVEFYMLRGRGPSDEQRARMRALVESEMSLAAELYSLARRHSVIAYEATNHYYYRPLDLAEAIIRCRHILDNDLAST